MVCSVPSWRQTHLWRKPGSPLPPTSRKCHPHITQKGALLLHCSYLSSLWPAVSFPVRSTPLPHSQSLLVSPQSCQGTLLLSLGRRDFPLGFIYPMFVFLISPTLSSPDLSLILSSQYWPLQRCKGLGSEWRPVEEGAPTWNLPREGLGARRGGRANAPRVWFVLNKTCHSRLYRVQESLSRGGDRQDPVVPGYV